ncbi:MAG: glycosyltransferase, partial [Acidimicrobiales bacterium]
DRAKATQLAKEKESGGSDLLFVGRIVPNKAQHDLVRAFYMYRKLYDPSARLHLVGRSEWSTYDQAVNQLIHELDLEKAVRLPGQVSQGALAAYYEAADVFVSASDHEGFCVPLLEAMHHRVPVVAYGAAAIPETVGSAGVVIDSKSPLTMAAAIHRVAGDPNLSERLANAGDKRLSDFALHKTKARMTDALRRLLDNPEVAPT